jgi:hypothetical protein
LYEAAVTFYKQEEKKTLEPEVTTYISYYCYYLLVQLMADAEMIYFLHEVDFLLTKYFILDSVSCKKKKKPWGHPEMAPRNVDVMFQ